MDTETAEAIDALRTDLRGVESTLRMDMNRMGERLEAGIRHGLAENRRHFEVLTESLRDDIRMIAEAVVTVDAKVGLLDAKVETLGRRNDRR